MSKLETTTIDFKKLYLEEKRKKKRVNKNANASQKSSSLPSIIATATATATTTSAQENQKYNNNYLNLHNCTDFTKGVQQIDNDPNLFFRSSISTSSFGLHKYQLSCKDPKLYYIPNFLISNNNHDQFISWLQSFPGYNNTTTNTNGAKNNSYEDNIGKWTYLKYAKRNVLLFDNNYKEIPKPLQEICNRFNECGIYPKDKVPNHILINEYKTGREGILPHTDGPNYYSKTCTISIGGDVLIYFEPRLSTNNIGSKNDDNGNKLGTEVVLHGNGSLLVFSDAMYNHYCHTIKDNVINGFEYASDLCCNAEKGIVVKRGYRISLTFRYKYKKDELL